MAQNHVRPSSTGDRSKYTEIEQLDDPGGARALISRRADGRLFTVAFVKTFERDDEIHQTSFFGVKSFDSLARLMPIAFARVRELELAANAGSVDKRA